MTPLAWIGCALLCYLLGSIPTGYLWGRARGLDIRTLGSGNIGATNVFRILGKGPGLAVLVLDALKGYLPVLLLPRWLDGGSALAILCTLCVIAGHNWTCWLQFKGGKGIATSAGALLAALPVPMLVTAAIWLVVFALSRYVSLASVAAALAIAPATGWLTRDTAWTLTTAVLGAVAIYKHRANLQRLRAGTEHRIGAK